MSKSICHKCFWPLTPHVEQGICDKPDSPVLCPRPDGYCVAFKEAPLHMSLKEAIDHAAKHFRYPVSRPTLVRWCITKGIGRQVGGQGEKKRMGRWTVFDLMKYRKILNGED